MDESLSPQNLICSLVSPLFSENKLAAACVRPTSGGSFSTGVVPL
ncbi:unnamed protein product [Arabidopsis lyrata]|nr:unnamed protein product [Arabidopsis lyrata]